MGGLSVPVAYAGLGAMSMAAIYIGSYQSIPKKDNRHNGEKLSSKDAYWFPVVASGVLFGLYLLFVFLPKELLNLVITFYFAVFGLVSLHKLVSPPTRVFIHGSVQYTGLKDGTDWKTCLFAPVEFKIENRNKTWCQGAVDVVDLAVGVIEILFTVYYVWSKNWIASNIFGEAFSISAISLLHLDSFLTGIILLAGLFVYDIFWVFGTTVMVKVAKSIDAPIKLLFPTHWGIKNTQFALLGLGDIVVPGIFIALCLRFDHYQAGRPSTTSYPKPYFKTCFGSYGIGMVVTVVVLHMFQAAQPALLYLCPACVIPVLLLALFRGEFPTLMNFSPDEIATEGKGSQDIAPVPDE